jgi:hypothetical protein
VSNKKDSRERHAGFFSPTSTNFFGTGLTLQEFMQLGMAEKIQVAWFQQQREERKRRLNFVVELSVELTKIKQEHVFCTGLAELGIESIIEGDWKMVQEWAEHFTFQDEQEGTRATYASVYARFSELLQQAYDTRPGVMEAKA